MILKIIAFIAVFACIGIALAMIYPVLCDLFGNGD